MNLSVLLPIIAIEFGHSKAIFGLMGGLFSIVYGAGQIVNGQLAERLDARKILTAGMFLSAILNLIFGLSNSVEMMIFIWAVNGYAQSMGWPSVVKV